MVIDDLLLKKEEIPVWNRLSFHVPIHPSLIRKKLNPDLPIQVFSQSVQEWHIDLQRHILSDSELEDREAIKKKFSEKPKVKFTSGFHRVFPHLYDANTLTFENGFAWMLSIGRNSGSLMFEEGDPECQVPLSKNSKYVQFDQARRDKYKVDFCGSERFLVYAHHNIDTFPAALLLRNWAINYLNAALKA